jgi:hypothetical protein
MELSWPVSICETLVPTPYSVMASASSSATMAIMHRVRTPLARYSHRTSTVEAGSVAEAMAPKTTPAAIAAEKLPVTFHKTSVDESVTRTNEIIPSHIRIEMNCLPYLRNVSARNSPPTRKPIMPRANHVKDLKLSIWAASINFRPLCPTIIPNTI